MGRLWIGVLGSVTIWGLVILVFAEDANPLITPDPLDLCSATVSTIGEAVPCLKETLKREEERLSRLETKAEDRAKKVESRWPDLSVRKSLTQSTTKWKQYRDKECERRDQFRAGGNHPDITLYECMIQKTRERIQDLSFDE